MWENKKLAIVSDGAITNFPLYVYWSENQENTNRHTHEFVELVLVFKGHAEHCCNGKTQPLQANDVFVIPRGFSHEFRNVSDDFSLANILYIPELLPIPILDAALLPGSGKLLFCRQEDNENYPFVHIADDQAELILELTRRLHSESCSKTPGHLFCQLGIFMEILAYLSRIFSVSDGICRDVYQNIYKAIEFLNKHYRDPLNISILCKTASMSRPSLQRNFLKATGCSPVQYMLQLRIAEAVMLLRSSSKSLTEISEYLGFSDCNYFSRQFKKKVGISPGTFRKKQWHSGGVTAIPAHADTRY